MAYFRCILHFLSFREIKKILKWWPYLAALIKYESHTNYTVLTALKFLCIVQINHTINWFLMHVENCIELFLFQFNVFYRHFSNQSINFGSMVLEKLPSGLSEILPGVGVLNCYPGDSTDGSRASRHRARRPSLVYYDTAHVGYLEHAWLRLVEVKLL